ncbi:5'-nucleotidase [Bacillus methanolicus PB1]|uniref:5'-nucleotidase n=1 Tax=Bacillus methanolicus PB1 TaxID=997296 RepID=I3E1L6_BACMT|nr:5'-nucleotidase C-terminal domain-containing protein [Bacillus methanolicus]EIJ80387.1 5'-nucleotidase [Bacillus methanolicus PB1]
MRRRKTKKLVISIATVAAVATNAVVVSNPAQAAATSNAEKLVVKAEKLAKSLKSQISYEYRKKTYPKNALDYPNMGLFNETKAALEAALEEVKKLKGKEKETFEARLSQNVQLYVDRATSYIDAVTAGKKIEAKANKLEQLISSNIIDDSTETAYHDLTKEITRYSPVFNKVYDASTRSAFVDTYVKPAQLARDAALYPISIKIETDRLNNALNENKLDQVIYHKNRIDKLLSDGVKHGKLKEYSNLLKSVLDYVKRILGKLLDTTAPKVSLVSDSQVTIGKDIVVRANELGTVYLVPSNETPSSKSALETLVTNGIARKATVSSINREIKISTTGLTSGTYKVYAVDLLGNVSNPTEIVTLTPFKLTVMHTNDTHAHLDNIARRITAIKQVRQANPNSLLLDAGDVFSGTLYFSEFNGLADLEFMNLAGYDAMTFGNHEFDKGTATLANFVKDAKFPFVSANVDFSKDDNLKVRFNNRLSSNPENGQIYNGIIKKVNGEKIGIFGLTTAETKYISSPGKDVVFEDYIEEAEKAVEAFESQGVNKIIALTHIGYNDGGGDNDLTLAKEVEGIDVIVGGHSHDKLAAPVVDQTGEEPTIIVQANEYSKFLGTLDVEFDKNGKVIGHAGKLIEIDKKVNNAYELQDDSEAAQILAAKYKPTVVEKQNTVVGQAAVDLIGGNPPARVGETNLGNLITDGMLAKAKTINPDTVIALQNGGGIRVSVPAGNITLAKILEVLPFGNSLGLMRLTGAEIKEALEFSVKDVPKPFGGFLQVSGMKFIYDSRKPAGERVLTVEVNEGGNYVPLDPAKTYVVATNIFTAKGGDGYTMFAKAYAEGRVSEPGFVDWEMFRDYISAQPNQTVNPSVEGRIIDAAAAITPVNASDFSGTVQSPKVHNGNISVDVTGVDKLEYATVKGDLYLKGNSEIVLDHVTVEGETYFLD